MLGGGSGSNPGSPSAPALPLDKQKSNPAQRPSNLAQTGSSQHLTILGSSSFIALAVLLILRAIKIDYPAKMLRRILLTDHHLLKIESLKPPDSPNS